MTFYFCLILYNCIVLLYVLYCNILFTFHIGQSYKTLHRYLTPPVHGIRSKSTSCLHPPNIPKKAVVWEGMPLPCRVKTPPGEQKSLSAEDEPGQKPDSHIVFYLISVIFKYLSIYRCLSVCLFDSLFEDLKESFI